MDFKKRAEGAFEVVKEEFKKAGISAAKEIGKEFKAGVGLNKDLSEDDNEDKEDKLESKRPKILQNNDGTYFAKQTGLFGSNKLYFPYGDWKHKVVIGGTGYGKSTWAKNYVVNCNHGCCYIDNAKGEDADDILRALPPERLRKTVVLDHSDKDNPLPAGVVEGSKDVFKAEAITNQWINFFTSNFGIEDKYRTKMLIKNACKTAFALEQATILDVVEIIKNDEYRNYVINKLNNTDYKDVKEYWRMFDYKDKKEQRYYIEPVLNRTGLLLSETNLRTTLGQIPKNKLEYKKWMDEGWTVIIKAPEKKLNDVVVQCIVALHVLSFWRASLDRNNVWSNPGKQFTVIADEPQSWLGSGDNKRAIDNIFSKARKNRLNMMCLIQSSGQLPNSLLKIMLDNEPDVLAFSETDIFKDYDFDKLNNWCFRGKIRGHDLVAKAPDPPKKLRSMKKVREIIKQNKNKYNKNYRVVRKNIDRRFNVWEEREVSGSESQSKSQTPGSETSVSQDSLQEISKSYGSSIEID